MTGKWSRQGSSPGLFSSVTVESELILKGHGISSESSDVNIILRDNQESALRFAGKPRKILEITKDFLVMSQSKHLSKEIL